MNLYDTIFKRRSVRSYQAASIDEATINNIKRILNEAKQLDGCKATFELVLRDDVTDSKAPYYILAYCPQEPAEFINVGYVLQKMDLYLQSIGLGSVWLGLPKPKGKYDTKEFCIMMAFGKTDVPQRKSSEEFKRLLIMEISNKTNLIAQAARLAPSAMNSQPWKLIFNETANGNKVTVEYVGRGLMQAILKTRKSKIDMGIITRHIEIALQNEDKTVKSINVNTKPKNPYIEITW